MSTVNASYVRVLCGLCQVESWIEGMIHFDAITLVPVCVHSDPLGLSVCNNCQNDRQVN